MALHPCFQPASPQLTTPLPYIYIYSSKLHMYTTYQLTSPHCSTKKAYRLTNIFQEFSGRKSGRGTETGPLGDSQQKKWWDKKRRLGRRTRAKKGRGNQMAALRFHHRRWTSDIHNLPLEDWFMNKTCFWQIPQRRWWGVDWQPPWQWPLRWWRTHGHSQCPPGSRGSRSPECRPCCNTGQLGHLLACSAAGWLQETELFINDTNRTHPLLLQLMMMIIII